MEAGNGKTEYDDCIIIIDFGGQYCHLIARRIRELNIRSEIVNYKSGYRKIFEGGVKGIILSGGPASVYEEGAPELEKDLVDIIKSEKIPVLGLCYGHQYLAKIFGGEIKPGETREFGPQRLYIDSVDRIFQGLPSETQVLMSHGDTVYNLPAGFHILAHTENCKIAAYSSDSGKIFGFQFHPEVRHTPSGIKMLENFADICGCRRNWTRKNIIETIISEIKAEVGDKKLLMAISGGVDSTVAALLIYKAIGRNLFCVFVDTGLQRYDDIGFVRHIFSRYLTEAHTYIVRSDDIFFKKLRGITDPEEKRRVIGHTFIQVFSQKAEELTREYGMIDFLGQGTIYPDRVESAGVGNSARIKSHHNLMLPKNFGFKLLEPLKDLYKDEVREIGFELGLSEYFLRRHPFPGPGLAVRCIGEVDRNKIQILREADRIITEEVISAGIYNHLWQAFPVLIPVKTVGVMGDHRTYEYMISLRFVESDDAMTAHFSRVDWDILERISSRIVNEVKGVNRVVYDITNKPPSTIEYE